MKLTESALVEAIERHLARGGRLIKGRWYADDGGDRCAISCLDEGHFGNACIAADVLNLPIAEVCSFISGWDGDVELNTESPTWNAEAYALGQKLAKRYLP